MLKIKKNDEVLILTGKDKNKRGKVLKIYLKENRVLVEGINVVKKHVKPNPRTNSPGGISSQEASIHISNVALYNPLSKKADKVSLKLLNGKKVRYFKSNNELVDI